MPVVGYEIEEKVSLFGSCSWLAAAVYPDKHVHRELLSSSSDVWGDLELTSAGFVFVCAGRRRTSKRRPYTAKNK